MTLHKTSARQPAKAGQENSAAAIAESSAVIAAVRRAQAVIEFEPDGTILKANPEN